MIFFSRLALQVPRKSQKTCDADVILQYDDFYSKYYSMITIDYLLRF